MKKLYAALALAMAGSLLASAGSVKPHVFDESELKTFGGTEIMEMATTQQYGLQGMKKPVAKAPLKKSDILNFWTGSYRNMYTETASRVTHTLQIIQGEKENEVMIFGLMLDVPLPGTLDLEKGTITIPQQICAQYGKADGSAGDLWFLTYRWTEDGDMLRNPHPDGDPFVLEYLPNGMDVEIDGKVQTIYVGYMVSDNTQIGIYTDPDIVGDDLRGFACGFQNVCAPFDDTVKDYGLTITTMNSDWVPIPEKAKFTDGWFSCLLQGSMPSYDVEVCYNKNNHNEIMLRNPYGEGTPWMTNQINNGIFEGNIVLDISHENCVLVKPLVPSGMSISAFGGCQFFCASMEGVFYYLDGITDIEELISSLEMYGYENVSTMDDAHVVTIENCVVSDAFDILGYTEWTDDDDLPYEMVAQIQLPEELFTGVEGITNDVVNGPKRFFNLQGVEVSEPVQGQVVIVKEGNKVSKEIAR